MPNLPIVHALVTLRGNVGSLDAPIAAHLFTFGPTGQGNESERVVNGLKKSAKIGKANGMPNLPMGPSQVTLKGPIPSIKMR